MRICGSSKGGIGRRAAVAIALLASVGLATELWMEEIPSANVYVVTASLVPGDGGAEVCGGGKEQGHVDFRIGFDIGGVTVNGVAAGCFDPGAAYGVTVSCWRCGPHWLATTRVVNLTTGQLVFEQANYKMPAAAEVAWATGADVFDLRVE